MMGIACFFGHKWKVLNIINYLDISWDDGCSSNKGTMICERCKKMKTYTNYGCGFIDDEIIQKIKELE